MCFQLQEVPCGTAEGFVTPSISRLRHFSNVMWYESLKQVMTFSPEKHFKLTVQAGEGRGLWHWVVGDTSEHHNEKSSHFFSMRQTTWVFQKNM